MTTRSLQREVTNDSPRLSDVLPIKFSNGQRVETLTMVCPDCRRVIPEKEIRASISIFPANVASVRASAHCAACRRKLVNTFRIRATGQGFQLEEVHDGFTRVFRVPARLNFLERIRAALRQLRLWARS